MPKDSRWVDYLKIIRPCVDEQMSFVRQKLPDQPPNLSHARIRAHARTHVAMVAVSSVCCSSSRCSPGQLPDTCCQSAVCQAHNQVPRWLLVLLDLRRSAPCRRVWLARHHQRQVSPPRVHTPHVDGCSVHPWEWSACVRTRRCSPGFSATRGAVFRGLHVHVTKQPCFASQQPTVLPLLWTAIPAPPTLRAHLPQSTSCAATSSSSVTHIHAHLRGVDATMLAAAVSKAMTPPQTMLAAAVSKATTPSQTMLAAAVSKAMTPSMLAAAVSKAMTPSQTSWNTIHVDCPPNCLPRARTSQRRCALSCTAISAPSTRSSRYGGTVQGHTQWK